MECTRKTKEESAYLFTKTGRQDRLGAAECLRGRVRCNDVQEMSLRRRPCFALHCHPSCLGVQGRFTSDYGRSAVECARYVAARHGLEGWVHA